MGSSPRLPPAPRLAPSLRPGEPGRAGSPFAGPGSGLAPPGAEELYFCTETFPAGAPFTLRDRGRHRLRDRRWRRAQAVPAATRPAPLTHPRAAPPKPPGAAGFPRGRRRLLPAPLRRTSRAGGRREHLGKRGPGPACVGCSPSLPQPQRGPRGGTGTPAPEPRGWARPRSVRLGNRAASPRLRQRHCLGEKGVRGRARVLANIYSEIHNCFALYFLSSGNHLKY